MKIQFIAYGLPEPQGSIRAFMPKGWKRPVLTSDNPKVKYWRGIVAIAAQAACQRSDGYFPCAPGMPVQIDIHFFFLAPKHSDPTWKTTRPDLDKLIRSTLDAMTGIVYRDDSQVVRVYASKEYGKPERAEIFIESI